MSRRFQYDVLLSVDKSIQLRFYFGVAMLKSALVFTPGHIGRESLGVVKPEAGIVIYVVHV